MKTYDLAIIWEWPFDEPFNRLIQDQFSKKNLAILFVNIDNVLFVENKVSKGEIRFNWYLDRASESDPRFLPLIQMCQLFKFKAINSPRRVQRILNKAYLHKLFLKHGISVPQTLILPPFSKKTELPFFTLTDIGIPFVMKPSHGGGGEGVHVGLTELNQIHYYRKEFQNDDYLIQQTIVPKNTAIHPLWFRTFHVFGETFLCFWNPQNRLYTQLHENGIEPPLLEKINSIMKQIARISKLNFFSSEIAVQTDDKLVVVDYVNDPIDFRMKSHHFDGIPDNLLESIAVALSKMMESTRPMALADAS
ncbi:MAG: hypothetical protein JW774_01585 [Candidatus Aureabacteria bacterium]|nr:hypothetical protein [Candidatus Auribacterota bacterium]